MFSVRSLLAMGLLAACGESSTPTPDDAGGGDGPSSIIDGASLPPDEDEDNDGLCNDTEISNDTDPFDADTDGDGFSDYAERYLSLDPVLGEEPDRDTVFILRESESATVQIPVMHDVEGLGEDFTGAFESSPIPDTGDVTAQTFYVDSVPTFAVPEENVSFVDESGEAFRGVVGETLLGFEVRFAFAGATPRLCIRGFPFRYNIKRNDGRLEAAERFILVTLPPGETLATGEWCLPPGDNCI